MSVVPGASAIRERPERGRSALLQSLECLEARDIAFETSNNLQFVRLEFLQVCFVPLDRRFRLTDFINEIGVDNLRIGIVRGWLVARRFALKYQQTSGQVRQEQLGNARLCLE